MKIEKLKSILKRGLGFLLFCVLATTQGLWRGLMFIDSLK